MKSSTNKSSTTARPLLPTTGKLVFQSIAKQLLLLFH